MIGIILLLFPATLLADGESDFPEGVIFSIEVDKEVEEGRVYYQKTESSPWAYTHVDCIQKHCEAYVKTRGSSYVPVGTKFNHYFDLVYTDGTQETTETISYVYLDNRFEWLHMFEGVVHVYYYNEYVENRAELILGVVHSSLLMMGGLLGITPTEDLNIIVYNNYKHMVRALPFVSQMANEQLKTEGLAFSDNRVLFILGQGETTAGIASHEFVHLLVHEASGKYTSTVPSWLNEGLAEVGNIDPTPTYKQAFHHAVMTRQVKPLWWLHDFSGTTSEDIMMAYGIGENAVRFMIQTWGPRRISGLFRNISELGDFDEAMVATYGVTEYEFDAMWRRALKLPALPPPDKLDEHLASFEKPSLIQTEEIVVPLPLPNPTGINPIIVAPPNASNWFKWGKYLVGISIILLVGLSVWWFRRKRETQRNIL